MADLSWEKRSMIYNFYYVTVDGSCERVGFLNPNPSRKIQWLLLLA